MTRRLVAALLLVGGAAHFVVPGAYDRIVPPVLGPPRPWVYASGVVEVASGALLLGRRARRLGGFASAAVLVAIFPANIQHAVDGGGLLWARLPLQVPLVWWALREGLAPQAPGNLASRSASSSAGVDGTE